MAIKPILAPSNMVNISFSGRDYKELIISMEEWIHGKNGMNGSVIAGLIPGTVIAQSGSALKTFEDWVKRSIGDLSQDAKTTTQNEQTLETAMNKMADKDQEIKTLVDQLDKQIKDMTADMDAKIKTLSASQQAALASMNNNQRAAMQALTMEWQLGLQNLKDNLVPKINALEALHQGVTPSIHKVTKPIIQRGTPLYNFDMRIDTNGSHVVRTVIPYSANYWVRYWTQDKKTSKITEHIMQAGENDDLRFFNENNFLAFEPKAWPNDMTTLQIWPATAKPISTVSGSR